MVMAFCSPHDDSHREVPIRPHSGVSEYAKGGVTTPIFRIADINIQLCGCLNHGAHPEVRPRPTRTCYGQPYP